MNQFHNSHNIIINNVMATPEEEEHLTYGPKSIRSFIKLSLCFEFLASNYVMFY